MDLIEYKPLENMRSSYKENNIGKTLKRLVLGYKPRLIVECGILDGYSLYHLAKATKLNSEAEFFTGHVIAYDLFEDYMYTHGNAVDVHNMLKATGVDEYATVLQGNAFTVQKSFEEHSVDMLHIDISNDGNTYLKVLELWGNKIPKGGVIVLEGGSEDRDSVGWMVKYGKRRICSVLPLIAVKKKWKVTVLRPFPSLTVLRKM